ncbi:MAG: cupin domain-containing protein [Acidobacteria bacterium]|nr:cupin domain-containing protein [Acidobacteriota bacterium]
MRRVAKPWGEELIFAETDRYAGKILVVKKGEILSLQYHEKKEETLYLYRGRVRLWIEEDSVLQERVMLPGDSRHIRPLTRHRMEALEDSEIFEVSSPELDDVVRLEDRYGRAPG